MSNIRRLLARIHVYQFVNFLSHVTVKRPRTVQGYQNLVAGKYLENWQGRFLIKHKAKKD